MKPSPSPLRGQDRPRRVNCRTICVSCHELNPTSILLIDGFTCKISEKDVFCWRIACESMRFSNFAAGVACHFWPVAPPKKPVASHISPVAPRKRPVAPIFRQGETFRAMLRLTVGGHISAGVPPSAVLGMKSWERHGMTRGKQGVRRPGGRCNAPLPRLRLSCKE